jgi:hypothetical protein
MRSVDEAVQFPAKLIYGSKAEVGIALETFSYPTADFKNTAERAISKLDSHSV